MARREERTLGDVRAELRVRLGFGQHATAANDRQLDSILAEAQETLLWQADFPVLRREHTETTITGERLYDLPDDCDARRTRSVSVAIAGVWRDMQQGIGPAQDTYRDILSFPVRWDMIAGQLELYPTPDIAYPLRIEYFALPELVTKQNDRLSIDSRLVVLQAIVIGKAHFRQPDSESTAGLLASHLRALQGRSHMEQTYSRLHPRTRNYQSPVRPVMV